MLRANFRKLIPSCNLQAGTLRTWKDTVEEIDRQYEIAFTSTSARKLQDAQRDSGVKDTIAQPFLDMLVKRRQELQATSSMQMPAITEQLRSDFEELGPVRRMNRLLSLDGRLYFVPRTQC